MRYELLSSIFGQVRTDGKRCIWARVAQDEAFSEKLTSLGGLVFLLGWNERKKYSEVLFSIFDPPSQAPQISHYNAIGKFCTGQLHPLEAVKCFDHFTRLFLSRPLCKINNERILSFLQIVTKHYLWKKVKPLNFSNCLSCII